MTAQPLLSSIPAADPTPACRVCRAPGVVPFATIEARRYWRCTACEAVLLDAANLPSPQDEFAHYRNHNNDPHDPGYRRFLSRLCDPLVFRLQQGSRGLDYGCGPGPALASMLREDGHAVQTYDPFFEPQVAALEKTYQFITCTEVAEHFHDPAAEFDRLVAMLEPGGWLALMTCFRTDDHRFREWHYRRDPTHVVFYSEETIRYVANRLGLSCEIPSKDIALMRKPSPR